MEQNVLLTPGHLISLAARRFAKLSENRLKPLGFGVGQIPVLVALQQGHAQTQRELATFVKVEQPPMAQMLTRMERDDLIIRTPDPLDKRSSHIQLTQNAQQKLPHAIDVLFQGNIEALKGFSTEEKLQLTNLLTRLIANLDEL
ncbi:MAG: MarR family transcriptional regulator [Pseudomonadota bacterium]|nr:MarR family transcriptional regulator [Pseudomonadota bacterium]